MEIWGERLLIASFPSFWEGQERGSRGVFGDFKTVCGLIVSRHIATFGYSFSRIATDKINLLRGQISFANDIVFDLIKINMRELF